MTNPLMDLIGSGEGHYNSYNRGTVKGESGKDTILPANQKVDFSAMTIEEIKRRQALPPSDPDRMLAVGRYQFIPVNLREAVRELSIDESTLFAPELQDKLFNEYLLPQKRHHVRDYIAAKEGVSLRDAQKAICKEWASVEDPDTPGHVYAPYEKRGNKMHTRAADIAIVLDEMRGQYRAQIEQGLSPSEAWSATTTMGPGQNALALRGHSARQSAGATLRLGAHGPAVSELQSQLGRLGYTDVHGRALAGDGHFGKDTRHAVEAFQSKHALAADGIAGVATLAALSLAVRNDQRSIGQRNASYLQSEQSDRALSAYRVIPEEPALASPVMPVVGTVPQAPKVDGLQAAAYERPEMGDIRVLQENLNTLGVTDMKGDPLAVHGMYDTSTQTAVARFQSGHGLPVTGQADETTRSMVQGQAFIADLQQAAPTASREAPTWDVKRPSELSPDVSTQANVSRSFAGSEPSPLSHSLHDPRHPESPNHELYNELQRCIPDASENRLLQFTAVCHKNMITADNLSTAYVDEVGMAVHFRGSDPLATPAQVDLNAPSPKPEEAIQQIQKFDQQEMQLAQAYQMQSAQQSQSGPRL